MRPLSSAKNVVQEKTNVPRMGPYDIFKRIALKWIGSCGYFRPLKEQSLPKGILCAKMKYKWNYEQHCWKLVSSTLYRIDEYIEVGFDNIKWTKQER